MGPDLKVVQLHESNFRDPVASLRALADEIEAGEYGDVTCVAVSLFGDTLEVFGVGRDSEAPTTVCVLQAGAQKLLSSLAEWGNP